MQQRNSELLLGALVSHRSSLLKTAYNILGCRHSAEDVVQDAYFKINGNIRGEIGKPSNYVHRVVRNLSIDKLRTKTVERRMTDTEYCPIPSIQKEPEPSAEQVISGRQQLQVAIGALGELPQRTQTAFKMHRFDNATQQFIAQHLKVSTTLVNFMIRDACQHCRQRFL